MANQCPKHGPDFPSQAHLREALSQIAREIQDQPLRSSSLARIMREIFGGSDAGGSWDWRMAYDLMQSAAVTTIMQDGSFDALAERHSRSFAANATSPASRFSSARVSQIRSGCISG